jgi:hypothetical protein
MTPSAAQLHDHIDRCVRSVMTAAMRADPRAIDAVVGALEGGRLDPHSREFVREARRLVLACGVGLTALLKVHRPGVDSHGHEICRGCGTSGCRTLRSIADVLAAYAVRPVTVDRAEAWRRADAELGRTHPVALVIDEFEEGFIARPVPHAQGSPDPLLVIDRHTGALTRWPALHRDSLIAHYRNYVKGGM